MDSSRPAAAADCELFEVLFARGGVGGQLPSVLGRGGRVDTDICAHQPDEERERILDPDVMDAAAVKLVAQ